MPLESMNDVSVEQINP